MSCTISYKGKKYSEEQFKEYFINNKQEFATSIAKNKDVVGSFKRKMEGIDYVFSQSPELASIGSKAQYLQYLSTIFKTSKVKDIVYHGSNQKINQFEIKKEPLIHFGSKNAALQRGNVLNQVILNVKNLQTIKDGMWFLGTDEGGLLKELLDRNILTIEEVKNINEAKNKAIQQSPYFHENYRMALPEGEKAGNKKLQEILTNKNIGFKYVNFSEDKGSTSYAVPSQEQIHILGSKQDIEGFKKFINNSVKNDLGSNNNSTIVNNVNKLLNKLTKALKLSYEIIDFNTNPLIEQLGVQKTSRGFYHLGKVYLNSNMINNETPIHEFGHGLIMIVKAKNKVLYNNLVTQIKDTGILAEVKRLYPDLSEEEQIEEAIVTAIGRYGVKSYESLTQGLIRAIKRIFTFIKNKLGIESKRIRISELNENSTLADLANLLLSENEIEEGMENTTEAKPKELRYLFNKIPLKPQVGVEANEDQYRVTSGTTTKLIDRVSKFLKYFNPFTSEFDQVEFEVKALFKANNTPITGTITHPDLSGQTLTYDQAKEYQAKKIEKRKIAGKIVHKIIQIYFSDETLRSKYTTEKNVLLEEFKFLGGNPLDFNYLNDDYLKDLKARLGIEDGDKVLSEFMVFNEDINIGGTIDILIEHSDGTYSLYDFKTGGLNDKGSKAMKYNDNSKLSYSSKNIAEMQLGTYAMLLKSQYPNIRFKKIALVKLHSNNSEGVPVYEIDRFKIFSTLKTFFNYNPTEFTKGRPDLFDHTQYFSVSTFISEELSKELKNTNDIYEARSIVLNRLYQQLDLLRRTGGKNKGVLTTAYLRENPHILKQLESLVLKISELEGSEFGTVLGNQLDMSSPEMYTSVGFNVDNPLVKLFMKLRLKALNLIYKERSELYKESDLLVEKLLKEKYGYNVLTRKVGISLDYKEVFNFMWRDDINRGKIIVTENDVEWNNLTNTEKEYNIFYRDNIRDLMFSTLSTSRGIKYYTEKLANVAQDPLLGLYTLEQLKDKYKSKIDWYESLPQVDKWENELGKSFVYYEGFTPRLPKTSAEVDSKLLGLLNKEKREQVLDSVGNWALNKVTQFTPNKEVGKFKRLGVPLKYITDYNATSENQTVHTELIFKMFAKNMINKKHYDEVSLYGSTLADVYEFASYNNILPRLEKTSKFLRAQIINNLHDVFDDEKLLPYSKFSTINIYGKEFSLERTIRTLMWLASMAKLGFSVLGALHNFVLNNMLVVKNAVKGSIAKRILYGIENDDLDFTLTDLVWASKEYFAHIGNVIRGKEDKFSYFDKMYNVSQAEFVSTGSKTMLKAANNRIIDDKWLYAGYGLGDSWANSIMFLAIMKHKKNKDGNSFWDSYTVENNKLKYIGPIRGVDEQGNVVSDITGQELLRIKKIASRIVGEYDPEMKRMMEANAFMALFLQFKKYLPAKLEYAYQGILKGDFENASLGKYVEVYDYETNQKAIDKEGNPILKWESAIDKGATLISLTLGYRTINTFTKRILRALYLSKAIEADMKTGGAYWNTLSKEQKQHVIMQLLSLISSVSIMLFSAAMYGDADDDDKDPFKRRLLDLSRDAYTELNPLELAKIANKPTVVLPLMLETIQGINKLMFSDVKWDGMSTPGMKAATSFVPLQSSYYQNIEDPVWDKLPN